jgi:hypothetical protein
MATSTVLKALRHVWNTLEPSNCTMALMGGLSLSFWKHPRTTRDVDILIGLGNQSVESVLEVLQKASVRLKHSVPVLDLGSVRIVQLLYEPPGDFIEVQIDLLLAESEFHREALARRVPANLPGADLNLFTLSCEDILILKLNAGRIIDRADAAALLRANRPSLDFGYLMKWVLQYGFTAELSEAWNEAFPGEPIPGA